MTVGQTIADLDPGALVRPGWQLEIHNGVKSVRVKTADLFDAMEPGITPESRGASGQNDQDDAPWILDAFAHAAAIGRRVDLLPGSIYRVDSALSWSGDLRLRGNGARIRATDPATLAVPQPQFSTLSVIPALPSPVSVTAIVASLDYDLSVGASVNTKVSKITAAGHGLAAGDFFKIVCDDFLAGTDPSLTARKGEFAYVEFVSGNDIYTSTPLIDTYTIGTCRLQKASNINVDIDDVIFERIGLKTVANVTLEMIVGANLRKVRTNASDGPHIQLNSTVGLQGSLCGAKHLANDTAGGKYGYCVLENSCELSIWDRLAAYDCRHGWTTGTTQSSTGDSIRKYGRTRGFIVANCLAAYCTGSNFDTHQDAEGGTFASCHSAGSVRGKAGSGAGWTLRGHNHLLLGCTDIGSKVAVTMVTNYAGMTSDIEVADCYFRNNEVPINVDGQSGQMIPGVRISDTRVDTYSKYCLIGDYCEAEVIRLRGVNNGSASGCQLFSIGANMTLRDEDCSFDVRKSTGTDHFYSNLKGVPTVQESFRGRILGNSGQVIAICSTSDGAGGWNLPTAGFFRDFNSNQPPSSNGPFLTGGNLSGLDITWGVDAGRTSRGSIGVIDVGTAGNYSLLISARGDPIVALRLRATVAGVEISSIEAPKFDGQILRIENRFDATFPFAIQHNSANKICITRPIWLRPGQSVELVGLFGVWIGREAHGSTVTHPGYVSGLYYGGAELTALADLAVVINTLYAVPFEYEQSANTNIVKAAGLACYVGATPTAGNCKLGVYDSLNGRPNRLVAEIASDISTAVGGDQYAAFAASIGLVPGEVYWGASVFSATPTMRSVGADFNMSRKIGSSSMAGLTGNSSNGRGVKQTATLTYVSGSAFLPATFGASTVINTAAAAPIVGWKAA